MERSTGKVRLLLEVVLGLAGAMLFGVLVERLERMLGLDSLWFGVLVYAGVAGGVVLYAAGVQRRPLAELGLVRLRPADLGWGVVLAAVMFVVQMLPLLLMGMDLGVYADYWPGWNGELLAYTLYILLCVGVAEELLMRGFLLNRSVALFRSRGVAVAVNCLLFYVFHWPPVRFVPGEFYNIATNTVILSVFLLRSKRGSIVPLMLAHGLYDLLISFGLPLAMVLLRG